MDDSTGDCNVLGNDGASAGVAGLYRIIKGGLPNTRLKAGAMVTRIEGTPLAQSGTLGEMLIKVPGMTGSDEAPEVLGKGSPLIYINGRKMRDASELKRLHSEDIRDVEVINAPGAQYDAQVRAVVRIRTRNWSQFYRLSHHSSQTPA